MKYKLWLYHLLGAILAAVLSVSVIGCLITGFDLRVDSMVDLLIWCGAVSILSALLFRFRHGGWVLLCLIAAAAFVIDLEPLWEELQTILHIVTSHYHDIYDWPVLGDSLTDAVSLPFMSLSLLTALGVTYSWCRRKHIFTALVCAVVPVVPVFFTIETVPDEIYLYLLILGVSLLLLTDWVRRNNPVHCVKLTLRVAIPVAAALALLFFLNPREEYINRSSEFKNEVASWFQQMDPPAEAIPEVNIPEAAVSKRLRLRNVGPRNPYTFPVMSVTSSADGVIYLRGQDYDVYTGTGWEATEDRTEIFTFGGETTATVTVTTYGVRDILYVPYYSVDRIDLRSGNIPNSIRLQTYEFVVGAEPQSNLDPLDLSYTDLSDTTYRWASELTDEITAGSGNDEDRIRAICDYVRSSAEYDKSTGRMDSDWDDFAQWFLMESDTGYCVHFATAATVLLRAAGIPARYVEGYMVICHAGEDTVVTNQDAHAWVEYFDFKAGVWRVLEPTPADENIDEEIPTEETNTPVEPTESLPDPTKATIPEPSNGTEAPGNDSAQPQKKPFKVPDWFINMVWSLLGIVVVIVQAKLRIVWKRRRWNHGRPNEKALYRWHQSVRISRLIPLPLPEDLDILAQKAKFSQHTLTQEELAQFDTFRADALEMLREAPWYRQFILRWIMAIG